MKKKKDINELTKNFEEFIKDKELNKGVKEDLEALLKEASKPLKDNSKEHQK